MKKIHVSETLAFWVFYVLAWASVSVSVMLMYVHLRGNLCVAEAAVNAFVVMAPYFLLGAKWRWTALVPTWGVAAFYLTNLWYWRFFNDFMPLSNYFLWSNVGNEVIDTTLMLVKAKDMAFLLMPAVTTVAYFAMLRKPLAGYQVSSRWKWVSPVAAMALFGTCYSTELTNGSFGVPQVSPWVEYNQHGLVGYVVKESLVSLERKMQNREATDEDVKTIQQYNDRRMAIVADDTVAVHTLGGG